MKMHDCGQKINEKESKHSPIELNQGADAHVSEINTNRDCD